jgi:hypothetical protein
MIVVMEPGCKSLKTVCVTSKSRANVKKLGHKS